jgi:hypothetical protein
MGPFLVDRPVAKASQPMINAISWISAFVSPALAELERSMESLAWRQGWVERCTFGGRDMWAMINDSLGIPEKEILRKVRRQSL